MAQWIRSLTLVQRVSGSIPRRTKKFASIAARSINGSELWAGAADDKDLTVSSKQGK